MKTSHAKTLEELDEIVDATLGEYNDLVPALNRAYHNHGCEQSRHCRKIMNRSFDLDVRMSAAQLRSIRMCEAQYGPFVF